MVLRTIGGSGVGADVKDGVVPGLVRVGKAETAGGGRRDRDVLVGVVLVEEQEREQRLVVGVLCSQPQQRIDAELLDVGLARGAVEQVCRWSAQALVG